MTPLENLIIRETNAKDKESLDNYQLKKFKETIDYAKENSKFYKDRLKEVCTYNINSSKDIESIPFTYPKEVAERSNDFLCIPQKYVSRIVTLKTSGTTAADGKRIFFTDSDLNSTVNFFEEGFKAMVAAGDNVMIMMPGVSYGSLGYVIKKSLDRLNADSFIYGVLKDYEDAGKFIESYHINSIVVLPVQALCLSKIKEDIFKNNIKKLMLSGDYVPEAIIRKFNENNIKVFTHYGLTETGYGCAVECERLEGYHIRENDIYLEIVDPVTGCVLKDGNLGEIVITTFNREAMPLIRYRTGDYGLYKLKECKCGTFLKTLERSKGRICNEIFVDNKHMHISQLDEIFFRFESVLDYTLQFKGDRINIKIFLTEECLETIKDIKKTMQDTFNVIINIEAQQKQNIFLSSNTMIKRALMQ